MSELTPGVRCTSISTFAAVRSSTFLTFILPRSTALVIDAIRVSEVFENGMSRITSVFWSSFSIFALTLILPPRWPSLYLETSMLPPVGKSGYRWNSSPRRYAMAASHISQKLCGIIFEFRPTAMPSTPCANSNGNFTGNVTGSLLRPSYDICHSVVFGLNTVSKANLLRRASIYLGAAADEPVRILPQLPCVSISRSFCPICTRASPIEASPCGWNCMVCPTIFATLL